MIITSDIAKLLNISPKDRTVALVEARQESPAQLTLVPGQRVQAEVVSTLADNRYLTRVAKELLVMELPLKLLQGQTVELTFVSREPTLVFAMSRSANSGAPVNLSETGRQLGNVARDAANFDGPLTLPRISRLLDAPPAGPAALADRLRAAVTQSGTFYESHQAKWAGGELPLAELLQEPQGALANPLKHPDKSIFLQRNDNQSLTNTTTTTLPETGPGSSIKVPAEEQKNVSVAGNGIDTEPDGATLLRGKGSPLTPAEQPAQTNTPVKVPGEIPYSPLKMPTMQQLKDQISNELARQGINQETGPPQFPSRGDTPADSRPAPGQEDQTQQVRGFPRQQILSETYQRVDSRRLSNDPELSPAKTLASAVTELATKSAQGLESGGRFIDPQTLPIIKEQLALLQSGEFRWAGQAWPGQNLDWTIADREPEEGDEPTRAWHTRLRLVLPNLGEVTAKVRLAHTGVVVTVQAGESETAIALEQGESRLREGLERAGLILTSLVVKHEKE